MKMQQVLACVINLLPLVLGALAVAQERVEQAAPQHARLVVNEGHYSGKARGYMIFQWGGGRYFRKYWPSYL